MTAGTNGRVYICCLGCLTSISLLMSKGTVFILGSFLRWMQTCRELHQGTHPPQALVTLHRNVSCEQNRCSPRTAGAHLPPGWTRKRLFLSPILELLWFSSCPGLVLHPFLWFHKLSHYSAVNPIKAGSYCSWVFLELATVSPRDMQTEHPDYKISPATGTDLCSHREVDRRNQGNQTIWLPVNQLHKKNQNSLG